MNLLTSKIKCLKRELTALKTSHTRGLGNIKIYHYSVAVDKSGRPPYTDLVVTVQFDTSFNAYPLVQILPTVLDNGDYSMEQVGMDYSGSGYTVNARFVWSYKAGTDSFTVESTIPVTSVNYGWEE